MTPKQRLILAAHALDTGAVSGARAVDFLAQWVAQEIHPEHLVIHRQVRHVWCMPTRRRKVA